MLKNYIKKIKIGNIEVENNVFLAPMAGVTDIPFRKICRKFGPGLTYTEMASENLDLDLLIQRWQVQRQWNLVVIKQKR